MPDLFGVEIPFADLCGIEAVGVVDGVTHLRMPLLPQHGNNLGIAHGGVICTLLDIAMGTAARVRVAGPVMTLDMQVSFLNPGRGVLQAKGRVIRAGRRIFFCEGEVRADGNSDLVAKSSGIFQVVAQAQ